MYYIVYKVTNRLNSKFYIGVHATEDLNDSYLGSGIAIMRAVKRYGADNFDKEILHNYLCIEDMFAKEKEIVNEAFVTRRDTYNMCLGGEGSRGHVMSKEGKEALCRLRTGSQHSDETKKKMSESHKGKKHWAYGKTGEKNHWFGKKHSSETIEKMRQKAIGRQLLPETKAKISMTKKRQYQEQCNATS